MQSFEDSEINLAGILLDAILETAPGPPDFDERNFAPRNWFASARLIPAEMQTIFSSHALATSEISSEGTPRYFRLNPLFKGSHVDMLEAWKPVVQPAAGNSTSDPANWLEKLAESHPTKDKDQEFSAARKWQYAQEGDWSSWGDRWWKRQWQDVNLNSLTTDGHFAQSGLNFLSTFPRSLVHRPDILELISIYTVPEDLAAPPQENDKLP